MDDLTWLDGWIADEPGRRGITIGSLDNPGWRVSAPLRGAVRANGRLEVEDPQTGLWFHLWVDTPGGTYEGAGAPAALGHLIAGVRQIVNGGNLDEAPVVRESACIVRLERWFERECNGDWEHGHGIQLAAGPVNLGWDLSVDLTASRFDDGTAAPGAERLTWRGHGELRHAEAVVEDFLAAYRHAE